MSILVAIAPRQSEHHRISGGASQAFSAANWLQTKKWKNPAKSASRRSLPPSQPLTASLPARGLREHVRTAQCR